ncbi:hypothetical protein [Bacillus tropicus]|uniref:hypothetical protein n=1 Tax=Bacillus tropicus TaxID=2026188 RepID=UPI0020799A5C|nr:hypothetical protein [Bacillus tropicus]USK98223.1 hypothetical protein LIS81_06545 [Bacillus tropicus]
MSNKKKALVKQLCICCKESGKSSNREHIFPQWLLKKTNTFYNPIRGTAGDKKITGNNCVIPICEDCNTTLGKKLEQPVSIIFENLESGKGFNDNEAELLVRWMWKITGMFYWIERANDVDNYGFINIRDRCTKNIGMPRDRISLAVSLIENERDEKFNQSPMGIDVIPEHSNILAAGVFNKVAIIVYYTKFEKLVPNIFTKYKLSNLPILMNTNNRILPKRGFKTADEAVNKTYQISNGELLDAHKFEASKQFIDIIEAAKRNDESIPEEIRATLNRKNYL